MHLRMYTWLLLEGFLILCGAACLTIGGWAGIGLALFYLAFALFITRLWLGDVSDQVAQILKRLEKGDFHVRLDERYGWGLRSMAKAFNRAITALGERFTQAESRERLRRAILDKGSEGILFVSREGVIVVAGSSAVQLLPGVEEGRPMTALSIPGFVGLVNKATESGTEQVETLRTARGSGGERILQARCVPIGNEGNAVFLRDVTERHLLSRVKSDLVANVSHELRTPVTSIVSLAEQIEGGDLDGEEQRDFIRRILRQSVRMQSLIEDLLTLSRLEKGEFLPEESEFSVTEMAASVLDELAEAAKQQEVTLRNGVPETARLHTQQRTLRTALMNIVDNAIRYNRPGGEVVVGWADDSGACRLHVTDSGEGIPEDHLPRVFERFYRVSDRVSRQRGGTGLGLSIVKHAVAHMGADVSIQSKLGAGTTVTILFPKESDRMQQR